MNWYEYGVVITAAFFLMTLLAMLGVEYTKIMRRLIRGQQPKQPWWSAQRQYHYGDLVVQSILTPICLAIPAMLWPIGLPAFCAWVIILILRYRYRQRAKPAAKRLENVVLKKVGAPVTMAVRDASGATMRHLRDFTESPPAERTPMVRLLHDRTQNIIRDMSGYTRIF